MGQKGVKLRFRPDIRCDHPIQQFQRIGGGGFRGNLLGAPDQPPGLFKAFPDALAPAIQLGGF